MLRIEEQPSIWRVDVNILYEQQWTADKGWSFRFEVGRGANKCSPSNLVLLRNGYMCFGPGLIL
jgi:hypothetical protein